MRRVLKSGDGAGWEGGSPVPARKGFAKSGFGGARSEPACQTGVLAPEGFSLPVAPSPLAAGSLPFG